MTKEEQKFDAFNRRLKWMNMATDLWLSTREMEQAYERATKRLRDFEERNGDTIAIHVPDGNSAGR